MRRVATIAFLSLTLATAVFAADLQEDFVKANKLFADRQYQAAADLYQGILDSGFSNSAVEYNLADAFYRLGRIGQARLHFERAARLSPNDPDIRSNIEIIEKRRLKQSLREENFTSPERVLNSALSPFPPDLTLAAALAAFIVLNLLIAARLFAPTALHPALFWTAVIVFTTLASVAFTIAAGQSILAESTTYGIIVSPGAEVVSEPASDAPGRFTAPEAMKVQIERRHEGWVEIILPNNAKGWVRASEVETI
jgi:tetratricopeptide (TPR) repeat protein